MIVSQYLGVFTLERKRQSIINSIQEVATISEETASGAEEVDTVIAVLLGKESDIRIFPASSDKDNSDKRALPALGYELYENGQACAAVQYYGGGLWGTNKNIVWIRNDLDNRKKLFLAAAVTSLLQHQMDNTLP